MRRFAAVLAGLLLTAATPPADIDAEVATFDEAIERSDFSAAAKVIDGLIVQRAPADGLPRRDAVINAMMGRMFLATQQAGFALTYLTPIERDELPLSLQLKTRLAYADALELVGRREEALRAYRTAASAAAANSPLGRRATLGVLRQSVISDPAAARQELTALLATAEPAGRWQVEYLMAVASSLLGDAASAAQFADRAWADSSRAPARDVAPLRVATLRAALSYAAKDRAGEMAMLAASNAMSLMQGQDLADQLPVCGDHGIQPSDFVVFAASTGPYNSKVLMPVAASRPGVVPFFHDQLAGRRVVKADGASTAGGTTIKVACVSKVSTDFRSDPDTPDPFAQWFAETGMYPATMKMEVTDEGINLISDRIDALESRFGKASPLLIQPRWQLLTALEMRTMTGADVPSGRLVELRNSLAESIRSARGPAWMADFLGLRSDMDRLTRAAVQGNGDFTAFQRTWTKMMGIVPFAYARQMVGGGIKDAPPEFANAQSEMVLSLRSRMPATYSGRQRQAWLLRIGHAQRTLGNLAEARKTFLSAGVEQDLCTVADKPPELLEQKFSPDDYPKPLIPAELRGYSSFEFDVTTGGQVASPRNIISIPAGLFDDVTADGLKKVRFSPSLMRGRPRLCHGHSQVVNWKLEDQNDLPMPSLLSDTTGDKT